MRWLVHGALLALLVACGGSSGGGTAAPPPGPTGGFPQPIPNALARPDIAFVGVNVIPMTSDTVIPAQTLVTRDGRILEIGPVATVVISADAQIVDSNNKYLMPGLADMHIHGSNRQDLFLFVANGVTTVRMMWGFDDVLDWRAEVAARQLLGPELYLAGPGIDGNPPFWPQTVVVEAENEARQAVAAQAGAGYDFIKVYNRLNPTAFHAIIDEARNRNIPVIGHVPAALEVPDVLAAGQASMEHLLHYPGIITTTGADSWTAALDPAKMAAAASQTRDAGVWNCPTLAVLGRTQNDVPVITGSPGWRYLSPGLREWFQDGRTQPPGSRNPTAQTHRKSFVSALDAAGAGILLGTDTGVQYVLPGYAIHEELAHLVDAGLSPFEAIRAGTADAAGFFAAESEFGTVAEGLRADLILLDANPLLDVANVQRRAGVMVRGYWWPEAELQDLLEQLARSYGQ